MFRDHPIKLSAIYGSTHAMLTLNCLIKEEGLINREGGKILLGSTVFDLLA